MVTIIVLFASDQLIPRTMKTEPSETYADNYHNYLNSQSIQSYLQRLSGQEKKYNLIDVDHNYAKPWNRHPDSSIRAKAAKFLFMKNFPKHFQRYSTNDAEQVDVVTVEKPKSLPIINADQQAKAAQINVHESNESVTPPKTGWTPQMHKLWTQAMKILQSDRLARLSYESLPNEIILKRNLIERTAAKLRQLFATAGWDLNLISWLNNTLVEYIGPVFLAPYHESMHLLKSKV